MTDLDPQAAQAVASAPMPTPKTLAARKNVLYQLIRFAAINLKMLKVITSGH